MPISHEHCGTTRSLACHQFEGFTHHQGHAGVRDETCPICQEDFNSNTPTLRHLNCDMCFCEGCITEKIDQYSREHCPWCFAGFRVPVKAQARRRATNRLTHQRWLAPVNNHNQMAWQQQRPEESSVEILFTAILKLWLTHILYVFARFLVGIFEEDIASRYPSEYAFIHTSVDFDRRATISYLYTSVKWWIVTSVTLGVICVLLRMHKHWEARQRRR